MSILKYTFSYMKTDHLRSPRMVLVRIQKIIITIVWRSGTLYATLVEM